MRSEVGDKIRLQHILDVMDEIQKYLLAADFSVFLENSLMRWEIRAFDGESGNQATQKIKGNRGVLRKLVIPQLGGYAGKTCKGECHF